MKRRIASAAVLIASALCGSALAQPTNQFGPDFKPGEASTYVDTRPDWREGETNLPAYPQPGNLIEFSASALSSFRFFVDAESIAPRADGIVRYTLVARSSSGSENVSFNGLRCRTGEHKLFANGRTSDKTWVTLRDSQWRQLQPKTVTRQHFALMRDFFCPGSVAILSRDEGVDALRRGIHPNAISNHTNFAR